MPEDLEHVILRRDVQGGIPAHHDLERLRHADPDVLRDPGVEDRGGADAEGDRADRAGVGRVRVRADHEHAGFGVLLENL